jgi:hypothetical protein
VLLARSTSKTFSLPPLGGIRDARAEALAGTRSIRAEAGDEIRRGQADGRSEHEETARADRRPPMTLPLRQERLLRRTDRALSQSDPDLATMLSIFARITASDGLPAWEQLRPGLTRALSVLLWPLAAIVFLAFFIADGELRPATACGAAVKRRALCLCLNMLTRAHPC